MSGGSAPEEFSDDEYDDDDEYDNIDGMSSAKTDRFFESFSLKEFHFL